ncbi:hypothetical protein BJX76DRAFT_357764 [Aspergillus varians]
MSPLFGTLKMGRIALQQRIAMAPMTRLRADTNHIPLASVKEYYQQRAFIPGTLLITEATAISPRHGGTATPTSQESTQTTKYPPGDKSRTQSTTRDPTSSYNPGRSGAQAAPASRNSRGSTSSRAATSWDVANKRTDGWGGDVERRSRFVVEVTRAVVKAVGHDRTAIRLNPWGRFQDRGMADPKPQFSDVVSKLAQFKLAYLHICESNAKAANGENLGWMLDAYGDSSPVIVAGNYNAESAEEALKEEYKGRDMAVAFGRPFIANPDLVFRVKQGIPFAAPDQSTIYANTSKGYTDYEFSEEFQAAKA